MIRPITSEKAVRLIEAENTLLFETERQKTKQEIKKESEAKKEERALEEEKEILKEEQKLEEKPKQDQTPEEKEKNYQINISSDIF